MKIPIEHTAVCKPGNLTIFSGCREEVIFLCYFIGISWRLKQTQFYFFQPFPQKNQTHLF